MTRLHDWTDDADQTTLALDAIDDALRERRSCGLLYCQRLIADGQTCQGALAYETDLVGRMMTVCGKCRHVAFVPRVRPQPKAHACKRCGRLVAGDNAHHSEARDPVCAYCHQDRKRKDRERERIKSQQTRARLETASDDARERMTVILALQSEGCSAAGIGRRVGLTGSRVRQILKAHAERRESAA